jgi:hypothetical protein
MGIKYEVVSRILSSAAADRSKLPITVYVGYPWPKLAADRPRKDEVWDFIRDKVKTAAEALAKTQANRAAPRLPIRVNRLRARHGGSVLDVLLRRVDEADIVIFDITELNKNVLIEIGMALALKGTAGSVFVLQKSDSKGRPLKTAAHPSDLNGYFFTRYQEKVLRGRSVFQLVEPQGFLAALRSRLINAARDRGLWRDPPRTLTEDMEEGSTPEKRRPAERRALKKSSRPPRHSKILKRKRTKRKP